MKKTLVSLLLGLLLASMAACGNKGKEESVDKPVDVVESKAEDTTEQVVESEESAPAKTGEELVLDFLNGEQELEVKSGFSSDNFYMGNGFEVGKTYNLDAVKAVLVAGEIAEDASIDDILEVNYGNLSVEQALGEWFCVMVDFYGDSYEATDYLILQAMDGKLYLSFSVEEIFRVYTDVNEKGIIMTGGSWGAGAYGYDYYAPDTNGEYQLLFRRNGVFEGWEFYEDDRVDIPINSALSRFYASVGGGSDEDFPAGVMQLEINGKYYYYPEDPELFDEFADACKDYNVNVIDRDKESELIEMECVTKGFDMQDLYADRVERKIIWMPGDAASVEKLQKEIEANKSVIGIATLGYEGDISRSTIWDVWDYGRDGYGEQYSFANRLDKCAYIPNEGEEVFLLVPVSDAHSITVYDRVWEPGAEEPSRGELLYEAAPGEIIIVSGNYSDIFSNIEIEVSGKSETHLFHPMLSLNDGTLEVEEGAYDFSVYATFEENSAEW